MNTEPEVMDDVNPEAEVSMEEVFIAAPSYWGWEILAALIFGILSLLGLLMFLVGKRYKKSPKQLLKKKIQRELIDERALYSSLLQACETNKNKTAAELLIKYAGIKFPETKIQNLGVLAKKLAHDSSVITELDKSLYAPDSNIWNGKRLHELLGKGLQLKQQNEPKQDFVLAPLYPN